MTATNILKFWRVHEPKRVEEMLFKRILRRTLVQISGDLLDTQVTLEQSERLHPALARMGAWSCLMRIEEDVEEEAAAWGMTVNEYRSRP